MVDTYDKIESALDRFQEAHYWIHMLEDNYHHANQFRWYLNSFIKSLKEIPQIIQIELQNETNFRKWYRLKRDQLNNDALLKALSKHRDLIVHKGMLIPNSHAQIGITEGRGMKMGITFTVHPLEDSDYAMERYLQYAAENGDSFGLLTPDEDSLPCVFRLWRLKGFEEEVVDLCAKAWLKVGKLIADVLNWLGENQIPELSLDCRHTSQQMQYKIYSRDLLYQRLESFKQNVAATKI